MPSFRKSASTLPGSSIFRQREASGVTTVTSQPNLDKDLAIFQLLTQPIALAGGKYQAKNSSFGRLSTATRVECSELTACNLANSFPVSLSFFQFYSRNC